MAPYRDATLTPPPGHAPPWLFGVLIVPFGIVSGYCTVALPFALAARHLPVGQIATVTALAAWPHAWKLLWAPCLDARWRRRSWYLASVALTALGLLVAVLALARNAIPVVTAALFVANAAVATSSAAVDALMATTVPDARKGAAAGWSMAGNLGGSGLGGALAMELTQRCSPLVSALVLTGLALATGAPAVAVAEAVPEARPLGQAMATLLRELWRIVRSTRGWTGLVLCLGPAGAGAAAGLFSAFAADYHASAHTVEWINGVMGGVVSAAGCLAGGWIADRMNRRLAYALAGALTAVAAVAMALMPLTNASFVAGCLAYQFASGVAFATWAAFVLEMIGHGPGAATKYALFTSAANQAITYMTLADGRGYDGHGVFRALGGHARGLLLTDALGTALGLVLLAVMVAVVRRLPPDASPPAAPASTASPA